MAKLLQRLGLFSAKRAWLVVISWFLILASAGSWAVLGMGKLSTSMSIEGIPSQKVIDELQKSFPEAARGNGQIVFHKADGSAFTYDDKTAITEILTHIKTMEAVAETVDPFKLSVTKADAEEQIADGKVKIAEGKAAIAANEKKIKDGEAQLLDAKSQLNAASFQLTQGKAELDKAEAQLASGKKKLDDGKAKLDANTADYETAVANLPMARMYRDSLPAGSQAQIIAAATVTAMEKGIAEYETGLAEYNTGLAAYQVGLAKYNVGLATYNTGKSQYEAGLYKYNVGAAELADGKKKLADGKALLAEKEAELLSGARLFALAKDYGLISKDQTTAVAMVQFDRPVSDLEEYQKTAVVDYVKAHPIEGVQAEFSKELTMSLGGLLGVGEILGILIAGIVLFVMLGTLIGAGLPLLAAIVGVGTSAAITLGLSGVISMNSTTPVLGVMLGLAVGIDYALFLLNRHRKQLKAGMPVRDSIALANGTSGNAVVFAGLTVIIALLALNITGIGFLGLMGTMAAMAIVISILIAITLTPAIMGLLGLRVLSKKERAHIGESEDGKHEKIKAKKLAREAKHAFVVRRPWVTVIAGATLLVIAAIPFGSMRLGLPDGSSEPQDSTQYKAYQLISGSFGAGANGQMVAVLTVPEKLETVEAENTLKAEVAETIKELDNVDVVLPTAISEDGTKYMFQVVPKFGPASIETDHLVYDIRSLEDDFKTEYNAELGVTGLAAVNIDVSQRMSSVLPLYLLVVILLSVLLMILVFRSIAVPIVASAGFLLSVMAAFGGVVAVYQWGWLGPVFDVHDPGPIMNFLPSIAIGILFGLAMDYQLFLATGMREAFVHGMAPKDAINHGLKLSRSVVLAAATIMVSVFGSFMFSHSTMIRPVGFALAAGVLFDAFIVRLLLMPAVLTLLGKAAWWLPKWLDRILPDVDVEGAKLERNGH